ncbi:MAG: BolA family transcriptional regulator [Alphaproteobacteria bacterium]|nr:BolA family transcriptional regulator [Alphaproteobacteria bacterium]
MSMAESMRAKLSQALAPEQLEIADDSHRHAGHAGARPGGETHFKVTIVAAAFTGKSRLERQRLVYGLLADEFEAGLHALQMVVHAPGEKA